MAEYRINQCDAGRAGYVVRHCTRGIECATEDAPPCEDLKKDGPPCKLRFFKPGPDSLRDAQAYVASLNPKGRLATERQ
ncbi:MAG: hypothetical protein AB7D27_14795 [Desulfomicrobium sp.]